MRLDLSIARAIDYNRNLCDYYKIVDDTVQYVNVTQSTREFSSIGNEYTTNEYYGYLIHPSSTLTYMNYDSPYNNVILYRN